MKNFTIIGHPVNHSLSPEIHNTWFEKYALKAHFTLSDIAPEDLKSWVKNEVQNYSGIAVTIPHKECIIEHIDIVSPESKTIGAVNTLYWDKGKLCGTNTDYRGFIDALHSRNIELRDRNTLILGSGGSAKAVAYGLAKEGANISIRSRNQATGQDIAKKIGGDFIEEKGTISPDMYDIVVNTTPVGLQDDISILDINFWLPKHVAFDIVYKEKETKFTQDAAQAGAKTLSGKDMLIHQAKYQFQLWNDILPTTEYLFKDE